MSKKLIWILLAVFVLAGVGLYANYAKGQTQPYAIKDEIDVVGEPTSMTLKVGEEKTSYTAPPSSAESILSISDPTVCSAVFASTSGVKITGLKAGTATVSYDSVVINVTVVGPQFKFYPGTKSKIGREIIRDYIADNDGNYWPTGKSFHEYFQTPAESIISYDSITDNTRSIVVKSGVAGTTTFTVRVKNSDEYHTYTVTVDSEIEPIEVNAGDEYKVDDILAKEDNFGNVPSTDRIQYTPYIVDGMIEGDDTKTYKTPGLYTVIYDVLNTDYTHGIFMYTIKVNAKPITKITINEGKDKLWEMSQTPVEIKENNVYSVEGGSIDDVTFASSNTDVATVDPNTGKITSKHFGLSTITISPKSGSATPATFKYYVYPSLSACVGANKMVYGPAIDDNGETINLSNTTSVTSGNESIIKITKDIYTSGWETVFDCKGISAGETILTFNDGSDHPVTTKAFNPVKTGLVNEEITITKEEFENTESTYIMPYEGETIDSAIAACGDDYQWPTIGTNDISFTPTVEGIYTLTISDNYVRPYIYYVIVTKPAPTSLTLDWHLRFKAIDIINKDGNLGLTPKFTGEGDYSTDVVWSSSDESILSFDESGKPTAYKCGDVIVTCASAVDPTVKDTCHYYITPYNNVSIGKTLTLSQIRSDDNEDISSWTDLVSEDPTIVKVNDSTSGGAIVEGVSEGATRLKFKDSQGNEKYSSIPCYEINGPLNVGGNYEYSLTDLAKLSNVNNSDISSLTDNKIKQVLSGGTLTSEGKVKVDTSVLSDCKNVKFFIGKDDTETLQVSYSFKIVDPITSFSISNKPTEPLTAVDETYDLTVSILPDTAEQGVTWESSNPEFATVDETGKVTAVSSGTTTITATSKGTDASGNHLTDTCTVEVKIPVTGITLNPTTLDLKVGGEAQTITATVAPEEAYDTSVTWESSDTNVATVENGVVTAVGNGTATITCTTNGLDASGNPKSATCTVTVTTGVTSVEIKGEPEGMLEPGSTYYNLYAVVLPDTASNRNVTWSSSNPEVATIIETEGVVTAVAGGTATITCTSVDNPNATDTCTITVRTPVTQIILNPPYLDLVIGGVKTGKITATVTPDTATDKSVIWESEDETIATVDQNGNVTAVGNGNTHIICKSKSDPTVSQICAVNVKTAVSGVELDKTEMLLMPNGQGQLTATVLPLTASNKNVRWSSDDENVATVDQNGLVTAKNVNGQSTTITVITEDRGYTATCTVTVGVPVTGVEFEEDEVTIEVGKTAKLVATVLPENATDKTVTYKSSNEDVATVDENGNVTALANGTVTITVTTNDGGFTDTCKVICRTSVKSVSLDEKKLNMKVGEKDQLYATINPETASNKNVTWVSSNSSVVYVSQVGKIYAKGRGTATITVITEDGNKKATCKVYVTQPVKSVKLSAHKLNMKVGEREKIYATVLPEDANVKTVKWVSNNTSVATVDQLGRIKAKSKGRATISVITKDGNKKDHCIVYVK